jgi:hypothetical protein
LFSIRKASKNGFNLRNDGEIIKLSKGNVTLTFDKVMRTKNGFVPGITLLSDFRTSVLKTKKRDTIDVRNSHKILGHCGEVNARLKRHIVMKLPSNLMSMKLVQLQEQGRTKN